MNYMRKWSNLYLSCTAYAPRYMDPNLVAFMNTKTYRGRVLWGSDEPWFPMRRSLAEAQALPLDDEAMAQFLGGTARRCSTGLHASACAGRQVRGRLQRVAQRGRGRSASSTTLRRRTFFGVTSTHSSSAMNSSACSSDIARGGTSRTRSSEPGGADVRELLLLGGVHVHLVGARVLADDHALVDLDARTDEHRAALLQVHQRVRGGHAAPVGDEAAGADACAARRTTARSRRTRGAACRCRASRS